MEAFLVSTGVVARGEIGDKTQLLAIVLGRGATHGMMLADMPAVIFAILGVLTLFNVGRLF